MSKSILNTRVKSKVHAQFEKREKRRKQIEKNPDKFSEDDITNDDLLNYEKFMTDLMDDIMSEIRSYLNNKVTVAQNKLIAP